jgi:hypothetical protein
MAVFFVCPETNYRVIMKVTYGRICEEAVKAYFKLIGICEVTEKNHKIISVRKGGLLA